MIRRALAWPIRLYRRYLSPLKPPCCRFVPSCSAYAIEAVEKRGPLVAVVLIGWRLLRCHPFCAPGFDPVPARRPPRVRAGGRRQRGGGSSS